MCCFSLDSPPSLQAFQNVFLGPGCHSSLGNTWCFSGDRFASNCPTNRAAEQRWSLAFWRAGPGGPRRTTGIPPGAPPRPSTDLSLGINSATSLSVDSVE